MAVNTPFTTHAAYRIDTLPFAYIKDGNGKIIARVQAPTREEANEIANRICDWSRIHSVDARNLAHEE